VHVVREGLGRQQVREVRDRQRRLLRRVFALLVVGRRVLGRRRAHCGRRVRQRRVSPRRRLSARRAGVAVCRDARARVRRQHRAAQVSGARLHQAAGRLDGERVHQVRACDAGPLRRHRHVPAGLRAGAGADACRGADVRLGGVRQARRVPGRRGADRRQLDRRRVLHRSRAASVSGRRQVRRQRRLLVWRRRRQARRQLSVRRAVRLRLGLLRHQRSEHEHLLQHGVPGRVRAVRVGQVPADSGQAVRRQEVQGVRRVGRVSAAHNAVRRGRLQL
jgi:hypothetical protein